jgi:hypothetical protein
VASYGTQEYELGLEGRLLPGADQSESCGFTQAARRVVCRVFHTIAFTRYINEWAQRLRKKCPERNDLA